MVDAMLRLRAEVKDAGLYERPTLRVVFELVLHISITLAGAAIFFSSQGWLLKLLGIAVATFGAAGVGTNSHTASHGAASSTPWVNDLLTYFGYPFFLQLSATSWHRTHVVRHHTSPNIIGVDGDSNLMPYFSLLDEERIGLSRLSRFYYAHQVFMLPLLLPFDGVARQAKGWIKIVAALRDPKLRHRRYVYDLLAMSLHYVAWIGIPMMFLPASQVLLFHYGRLLLLGYALFAILGPAHYIEEAVACPKSDKLGSNFLLIQTASTVNFTTGALGRFWISGLGNQIEHHLFPNICHVHLPRLSAMVQAFCEREGYPYRSFTWAESLRKMFQAFKSPKSASDLQSCRTAPRA
jgi:linoleoyl-CoA desaturase